MLKPTFVIMLFLSWGAGQTVIEGIIYDKQTQLPVADANVVIKLTETGTASDMAGRFELNAVETGSYSLEVSAIGYIPFEKEIQTGDGKLTFLIELTPTVISLPALTVLSDQTSLIGGAVNLFHIPGSAVRISQRELEKFNYGDINRILKQVPGLYLVGEDGFGLRPNIGMRGTGSERSQKIALMEDGVLIAPAPYAAPSAYYFPTAGRMETVEIRKGSSQIKYGPNTNGGALNLISRSIPKQFTTRLKVITGSFQQRKVHFYSGSSTERTGWVVETYLDGNAGFKELDNGGNTGYTKQDYLAKFRLNTARNAALPQVLELKWSLTAEQANETYLGLTDTDFASNPYRRYAASQKDKMNANHNQIQLKHVVKPAANLDISTTVYRNVTYRNWYKLDKVAGEKISAILEDPITFAEQQNLLTARTSQADAYEIKANRRNYGAQGIQSTGNIKGRFLGVEHALELGVRLHEDFEDRYQEVDKYTMADGILVLSAPGVKGSKDNRIGSARALAFFAQDKFSMGRVTLTGGVRREIIRFAIENWKNVPSDEGVFNDLERENPGIITKTGVDVWVPGIGVDYMINPFVNVFSGIHKGFSPPGQGKEADVRAENSLNTELGFRLRKVHTNLQAVAFFNRYKNLLGSDLSAVGGDGTGDQFNAGKVNIFGLEVMGLYTVSLSRLQIPLQFSYTYTQTGFLSSFESAYKPWGKVNAGDELPYVPKHQVFTEIGLEAKTWSLSLNVKYTGAMRTRVEQGITPDSDFVNAYLVSDFVCEYRLNHVSQLFFSVRNLTDSAYIVARRPAGIRPGLPRTISVGVKINIR